MLTHTALAHLAATDAGRLQARGARIDALIAGLAAGLLPAGEAAYRGWQLQAPSAAEAWLDPDLLTDLLVRRGAAATNEALIDAVELRRRLLEIGATALLAAAALGPEIDRRAA